MSKYTEIVFVLDRSGSMHGSESDIIGGFNSMIEKHRDDNEKAYVSTVTFNTASKVIHDRVPIEEVPLMTKEDFTTSGGTALLDAIGDAVTHIRNVHKYARVEDRPEHTLLVVMTDGHENASRRYNKQQIKDMVSQQQEKNWEFVFIGSDIDAFAEARSVGIRKERSINFSKADDSYDVCFDAIDRTVKKIMCLTDDEVMRDEDFEDIFKIFQKDHK